MTFNTIILCASAFLIQTIPCGYASVPVSTACGCGAVSVSTNCGCGAVSVPSNGGSLVVTSLGPLAPAGVAAATELALAADLALSGAVPFLSAIAFDGTLPTSGAASVAYGCGDGNIAITQEIGNAAAVSGLDVNKVGIGSCSTTDQTRGCGSPAINNLGSYGVNSLRLNSGLVAPAVNLPRQPVAGSYKSDNAALNSVSSGSCATYGGVGSGQVGVAGDVSACGNTAVVGSVPVLGAVEFGGVLPATGSVFIPGQCGCGCQ